MHVTRLELEEVRSYRGASLEVPTAGLRLFGANASGKTTLLEAVAMLATTRSARTNAEREVVNWASGQDYGVAPYARIVAQVHRADAEFTIELAIQVDPARGGAARRLVRLDGRDVRAADAVGRLRAVLFSVEDVALVSGPPAGRRRYLDLTISQLDGRYLQALSRFNRVLVQRNSLLKSFARDRVHHADPSVTGQLAFWDDELVASGAFVIAYRSLLISVLSERSGRRFASLAADRALSLRYQPSVMAGGGARYHALDHVDALQVVVAGDYRRALDDARRDDVRRGVTTVGPHRDDIAFEVDEIDIAAYGSRGEQRLAVVAVKLAEADVLGGIGGDPPVLLLDDVLSELDTRHRDQLVDAVAGLRGQVMITSTDAALLERPSLAQLPRFTVERGRISEAV